MVEAVILPLHLRCLGLRAAGHAVPGSTITYGTSLSLISLKIEEETLCDRRRESIHAPTAESGNEPVVQRRFNDPVRSIGKVTLLRKPLHGEVLEAHFSELPTLFCDVGGDGPSLSV